MPQEKKKRQHYVPRLILRRFSKDGRSISLLVLKTRTRIDGASLKEQCYRDHFYDRDKDGKIENAFRDVETLFSHAVANYSALEHPSDGDLFVIRFFALLQKLRTAGAAESLNETKDAFFKAVFADDPRIKDSGIDLSKFRIGFDRPQDKSVSHLVTGWPLFLDLEVKFLTVQPTAKIGFVVSDDPVVTYNQFTEHHPRFRAWPSSGLATKGLQLFLPLAPRICLVLYDPATYQYGSPTRRTCVIGVRDVRLLNSLQALHAQKCLYFDPELTPSDEVYRLAKEANGKYAGWRKPQIFQGENMPQPDGTMSQLVGFRIPDLRVGAKFGFVRVTDRASYDGYDRAPLPIRSRVLWDYSQERARELAERRAKAAMYEDDGVEATPTTAPGAHSVGPLPLEDDEEAHVEGDQGGRGGVRREAQGARGR